MIRPKFEQHIYSVTAMTHLLFQRLLMMGRFAKDDRSRTPSVYPHVSHFHSCQYPSLVHRLSLVDDRPVQEGRSPSATTTGFSLLEIIVVLMIIGILSAIAAPSWLAFTNRQRLNTARDEVVQSIRANQNNAKQKRHSQLLNLHEFQFKNPEITPDTITMTATDKNNITISKLQFAQDGTVATSDVSNLTFPLKVVLSPVNSTMKRCIFVESLLGSVRLEADSDCS